MQNDDAQKKIVEYPRPVFLGAGGHYFYLQNGRHVEIYCIHDWICVQKYAAFRSFFSFSCRVWSLGTFPSSDTSLKYYGSRQHNGGVGMLENDDALDDGVIMYVSAEREIDHLCYEMVE